MRILLAGESWVTHSVHVKGVDSFNTSTYVEGAGRLREALAAAQIEVDYLPAHLVPARFPGSAADLSAYGAIILSDIGANSLLLAPDTFERSAIAPNRLAAVEQYVREGGGLLMSGGYLSFSGIEGKARYHGTPVGASRSTGERIVVSRGRTYWANRMSSKPTMDRSPGTRMPCASAALSTPSAMSSLATNAAVGGSAAASRCGSALIPNCSVNWPDSRTCRSASMPPLASASR